MRDQGQRLFITRQAMAQAHVGPDPDAPALRSLEPGQARLSVETFALTANNITYAAFGEAMKYWQFFPASREAAAAEDVGPALGCLPVWGFATVADSLVPGIEPGRRVWGYYPAGTHLVVAPSRVSPSGFLDGAAHRQELAAVYNQYAFCDADPGWKPELEGLQAVLRPLFLTAFLLDDFWATTRSLAPNSCCCPAPPARPPSARPTAWRSAATCRGLRGSWASPRRRMRTLCARSTAMTR